jgi:molecular chaperone DnaJ
VPRLTSSGRARGRGDLRARVIIEVPTKMSSQERDLLRKWAELRGETVTSDEGLVAKIKSAFS